MEQAADTTVLAGVRRTAYLSAAIAGAFALLAGLFLAPCVGDALLGTNPLDLFPSLQNPAFNQPEPTESARYIFAAAAPVAAVTAVVLVGRRSLPAWAERAGQLLSIVLPVILLGALAVAWVGREQIDHYSGTGGFEYFGSGRALIAALLACGLASVAAHPSTRRLAARAASARPPIALAPSSSSSPRSSCCRPFRRRGPSRWVARLGEAKRQGSLEAELRRLSFVPLLVVDEVGCIPFDPEAANLMFSLVSARYERASLIVTSNKPFSSWGEIFGDEVVAAAMIDRLVHPAEILALKGDSYRLRDKDLGSATPAD